MARPFGARLLCVLLVAVVWIAPAAAEVVEIEIEKREPFAEGFSFDGAGPYERIHGKLHIEVDPAHADNRRITDIELAPQNDAGRVAFWTEFFLLKPLDPERGNGRILYDVNNRGNKLAVAAFNGARSNDPATRADAGNGFLMRRGYSILWCGWNGDVEPGDGRILIELPIARGPEGPITGKVYSEICVDRPTFSAPFCGGNTRVYPAVSTDHASATLTVRPRRSEPGVEIPHDQWAFARKVDDRVVPDPTHLYLRDGFKPGWLYDLVYESKDPRISGLGLAAVRDVVSWFRYAAKDRQGHDNPLAGSIERAYVFGISQSARFIRDLLENGFNGDEAGRTVFDAAFAHVGAAGTTALNRRFVQITRHGSQHEEILYPRDVFPFNTVPQEDPLTGQRGDWLARSRESGHLPKMFITMTSTEYWARGGSLLHTDVEGRRDVGLADNVRLYHIAGGHHLFFTPPSQGVCRYPLNALGYTPVLRALLVALDEWTTSGREPPESRYPRIADGTLVDVETYRASFPRIPGVTVPESPYVPLRLDPGPRWASEGIADHVPPKAGAPYRVLVPAVDADGNERAGIRLPWVVLPAGTFVGWNVRDEAFGAGDLLARWLGSSWSLPLGPEDRRKSGDPRLSLLERYPSADVYLPAFTRVARQLEHDRFLLTDDVDRMLKEEAEPWP